MSQGVRRGWLPSLVTACFIAVAVFGSLVSTSGLIDSIRRDLDLSFTQGGFLLSAPFPLIALFALTGGRLVDRFGVRRMLALGALLVLAGGGGRAWAGSFWALATGMALVGAGTGLIFPVLPKLVSVTVPEERRSLGATLYTASVVTGAGSGVAFSHLMGPLAKLVPLLPDPAGWRGGYLGWALVLLLAALLWRGLTRAEILEEAGARVALETASVSSAVFRNPVVWAVAASLFLNNVIFYTSLGWLPTVLLAKGWTPAGAAGIVSLIPWLGVIAVLTAQGVAARLGGERNTVAACAAVAALALGGVPESGHWLSATCATALGLSTNFWFLFCMSFPARHVERAHAGTAGGLIIGLGYSGGFFGPWVVGSIRDWAGGFGAGFYFMAALALAAAATAPFFGTGVRSRDV